MARRVLIAFLVALLVASMVTATPAAALPVITEQAALVVEPGQIGQLLASLEKGDSISGHVSVTPQDISLVVRDPDGRMIVNAGMVTEMDFSFVATTTGFYRFVFANTPFLVSNKVVLLRLQHTGATALTYFGGTYLAVKPGEMKELPLSFNANVPVRGSLQVRGGPANLTFSVTDPAGVVFVAPVLSQGWQAIDFTTTIAGVYNLRFDNTASAYSSRLVSLELSTGPGGQWRWGTPARLAIVVSPTEAIAESPFPTQPMVTVVDDLGNPASNYIGPVTLAIKPGTGEPGAILSGAVSAEVVNGMASFSGLSIDLSGSYALIASAPGLAAAVTSSFKVGTVLPPNCVALSAGWNLISLPMMPTDQAITSVLSAISDNVISVWRYDATAGSWLSYVPGFGGNLKTMADGLAYWVNMRAPVLLSINSPEATLKVAPPSYPVLPGWNMIGFKSTRPKGVSAYLAGNDYRVFPVYGYNSSGYQALNASGLMRPGQGYWVYFNVAGTIKP